VGLLSYRTTAGREDRLHKIDPGEELWRHRAEIKEMCPHWVRADANPFSLKTIQICCAKRAWIFESSKATAHIMRVHL